MVWEGKIQRAKTERNQQKAQRKQQKAQRLASKASGTKDKKRRGDGEERPTHSTETTSMSRSPSDKAAQGDGSESSSARQGHKLKREEDAEQNLKRKRQQEEAGQVTDAPPSKRSAVSSKPAWRSASNIGFSVPSLGLSPPPSDVCYQSLAAVAFAPY